MVDTVCTPRQVFLRLRRQDYHALPFQKMALYKFVRHPIMLGFLIAFWATPEMTQGHLLFALALLKLGFFDTRSPAPAPTGLSGKRPYQNHQPTQQQHQTDEGRRRQLFAQEQQAEQGGG